MTSISAHWSRLKHDRRAAWLTFLALGIVLAVLPFLVDIGLGRAWVRVLNFTLLYVMLALGLNIVVGYAGLLDLGYIAFYAVGAYVYALLSSPHFGLHLPFWITLPLGALVAAFFGVLLGAPTLRLRGDYLAIVTLGFGEIIRIFLNNLNAPINITNGPQGVNLIDPLRVGEFSLNQTQTLLGMTFTGGTLLYYVFLAFTLLIIFVCMRLQDSRVGRAWIAIREDEVAAEAMGVDTTGYKVRAFVISAAYAGLAGALIAHAILLATPRMFTFVRSIEVVVMIVLGGLGSITGSVISAVLLTLGLEALREFQAYRMVVYALLLIVLMLLRPQGIFGTHELWDLKLFKKRGAAKAAPGGAGAGGAP